MDEIPAWTHAQDMRALLEAVDKQEIKALSPGLGLGNVHPQGTKPKLNRPGASAFTSGAPTSFSPTPARSIPAGAVAKQIPVRSAPPPTKQASARTPRSASREHPREYPREQVGSGLPLRLLAWVLDFLLVVVSLIMAIVGMIALHAARNGGEPWLSQRPVQWLLQTSPFLTMGLVYAVFLVYGLLFKLVVGRTCGEALLGVHPHFFGRVTKRT